MRPLAVAAETVAVAALVYAALWYAAGHRDFPLSRPGAQANAKKSTRGLAGSAHFGAVMGVGFLTEMSTPFVWVAVAVAAWQGPLWGLLYGTGFAVGRSAPAWLGAILAFRHMSPGAVSLTVLRLRPHFRWPGLVVALSGVVLAVSELFIHR